MKVLYIYAGARGSKFAGVPGVDHSDTQYYGLNHLRKFGIDAEYKEGGQGSFRLGHFLKYFGTRGYDLVFGSALLYMLPLKMLLRPRRKFVLLNIGLQRILSSNRSHALKSRVLARLVRELDAVVCLARFQQEELEAAYPALRGKTYFVPLGVDTSYTKPHFEGRKGYVLAAGRDNGRDYKTVFETARLLPHREFQVVCSPRNVVGLGEPPRNVQVFFDLPAQELQKKYREAAALLLAVHADGHSDGADCSGQTVLLEAFASGLPVVASRKRYLRDYAEEGREFLAVPVGDAEAAAAALEPLLGDPARAEALARAARARAEAALSTEQMAAGLAEVFRTVLK